MPPISAPGVGGTAEDRLEMLLQRIERKREEQQNRPPANQPNGPQGPNGANGGPGGTGDSGTNEAPRADAGQPANAPETRDDYAPAANEAPQAEQRVRTTGTETPRSAPTTNTGPANPITEQRRLDTHLNEGHRPNAEVTPKSDAPLGNTENETSSLPTYGTLFREQQQQADVERRQQQDRFQKDLADRPLQRQPDEPLASNPLTPPPNRNVLLRNAVDCRDCHPTQNPDFGSDYQKLSQFFQNRSAEGPNLGRPPAKVDHDAITKQLNDGFDEAATGRSPTERGQLAQQYSDRLAMDESPNARRYERNFRVNESERLADAARGDDVEPTERERMQQLSHDVMRRPQSESTQDFYRQLQQMPVADLSHRDAKAALDSIRAHRPADANQYDPKTGLKPGHEDMFYTKEDEAKLFNPDQWQTPDPADSFRALNDPARLLGGQKCYDCHPDDQPGAGFDLSSLTQRNRFDAEEHFAKETLKREAQLTEAVGNKIRTTHPETRPGTEEYRALEQKYRDENNMRLRLQYAGNDPTQRLKIPKDKLDAEQRRVLADHVENKRLGDLEKKIRPHFNNLDSQYVKNGWADDSPFYGVDREAFLQDVNNKPSDRVSDYDKFRALDSLDSYKRDNPEMFDRDANSFESFRERVQEHEASQRPSLGFDQMRLLNSEKCYDCHPQQKHDGFKLDLRGFEDRTRTPSWARPPETNKPETPRPPTSDLYYRDRAEMEGAGLERNDIDERMRVAQSDPNNPIPYLKKPMSELEDQQHRQVSEDYTRYSVEQMERKFRADLVEGIGNEVDKLDRTFDRILEDQGVIGDFADMMKNNLGSEDGWIIDSNLGSNAVVSTIAEAYAAKNSLQSLKNFKGSHEDFVKQYQQRIGNLQKKINEVPRHIDKFNASQANWVEGVSDIASVSVALGAAALAPVTGGASLAVGAAAGALTKVGTKGLEAITGSGEYQGNVAIDFLKGGLNGASATGTNMLAQAAAKKLLANAATKVAAGQGVSMLTRGTIWAGVATGEGMVDGYVVGTSSSLIDGKSMYESQINGLRGAAFGAVLNPIGQGGMSGLRRLWKGSPPKVDLDAPNVPPAGNIADNVQPRATDLDPANPQPRVETPDDAKPKPPDSVDDVASARVPKIVDDVARELDVAMKSLDDTLDNWTNTSKAGNKQQQRVQRLRDEMKLAQKLLKQNPTEATAAAAREMLDASDRLRKAAEAYGALERPRRSPGRKTPEELEALKQKQVDFDAQEKRLRHELVDAYQSTQKATYEALRKTAGITVEPLDPTKPGPFGRRPVAEVEKMKLGPDEAPNRAYAELEIDGVKKPIGPTRSGGGEPHQVKNNPYEAESRPLESVDGQHNMSRANDSEVRILGLVNEALEANGGKPGTLRIFTELPPCASCQRVMAKFRADHPNIDIEVYHLPQ